MILSIVERSNGRLSERGLLDQILAAQTQLWLSYRDEKPEAVVLTEIVNYPDTKACKLYAATGHNRKNWVGFLPVIEEWARVQGCRSMEAFARPGWERNLPDYRKTHVFLEKDLSDAA